MFFVRSEGANAMPLSQHLRFKATESTGPEAGAKKKIGGETLIRSLAAGLVGRWDLSEVECWRESGWVVFCKRGETEVQILLMPLKEGDWAVQIAPKKSSMFGRFTEKPSASPEEIYQLAMDVHEVLGRQESYANARWCWDDYPNPRNSTPRPMPALSSSPQLPQI